MQINHIFIIGVGLIGGSLAIDLKTILPKAKIYGIDANTKNLSQALHLNLIHEKATLSQLNQANLVILATPVNATVNLLPQVLSEINHNTLVIDVGSTKKAICETVQNHPNRRNFLATHPIAGTEFSGPMAAMPNLFQGKTNIICEIEKTAFTLQEQALQIFQQLGMRIRYMHPKNHDKHIAYVSHLSHISSFMLGKTVMEKEKNERDIFDLAGSGFASTVRLAKSSPSMWAPIFNQNKDNVLETLEEYITNLTQFKNALAKNDVDTLYQQMQSTNHIADILKGIL